MEYGRKIGRRETGCEVLYMFTRNTISEHQILTIPSTFPWYLLLDYVQKLRIQDLSSQQKMDRWKNGKMSYNCFSQQLFARSSKMIWFFRAGAIFNNDYHCIFERSFKWLQVLYLFNDFQCILNSGPRWRPMTRNDELDGKSLIAPGKKWSADDDNFFQALKKLLFETSSF